MLMPLLELGLSILALESLTLSLLCKKVPGFLFFINGFYLLILRLTRSRQGYHGLLNELFAGSKSSFTETMPCGQNTEALNKIRHFTNYDGLG